MSATRVSRMATGEGLLCSNLRVDKKAWRIIFAGSLLLLVFVRVLEFQQNHAGDLSSINRVKGEVILAGPSQEPIPNSMGMMSPSLKPVIFPKPTDREKSFVRWESWLYTKTDVRNYTNVESTKNNIEEDEGNLKNSHNNRPKQRRFQDSRSFKRTLALNERSAYMIETNLPFSVVAPPRIPLRLGTKTRGKVAGEGERMAGRYTYPLWKTTDQSEYFHCNAAAMNGGPFHADGTSCGPLVLEGGHGVPSFAPEDSSTINSTTSTDWVGIGMARRKHPSNSSNNNVTTTWYWMIGPYSELVSTKVPDQEPLVMDSFVSGFGWLIHDGKIVVDPNSDSENNPTGALRAPRTAMGITREGRLILFVADGCERCLRHKGPTLWELANMMQERTDHRIAYAINLDGGGSSSIVYYEEEEVMDNVLNHYNIPRKSQGRRKTNRFNCLGVPSPIKCERKVASVICLRHPHLESHKY